MREALLIHAQSLVTYAHGYWRSPPGGDRCHPPTTSVQTTGPNTNAFAITILFRD
jgi:hypothetical protein